MNRLRDRDARLVFNDETGLRKGMAMVRLLSINLVCIGIVLFGVNAVLGQEKTISQNGVSVTSYTAIFSKLQIEESRKEELPHARDQVNVHAAAVVLLFHGGS